MVWRGAYYVAVLALASVAHAASVPPSLQSKIAEAKADMKQRAQAWQDIRAQIEAQRAAAEAAQNANISQRN